MSDAPWDYATQSWLSSAELAAQSMQGDKERKLERYEFDKKLDLEEKKYLMELKAFRDKQQWLDDFRRALGRTQ